LTGRLGSKDFWQWFSKISLNFEELEALDDTLESVHATIQRYQEGLGVEVSDPDQLGVRELVVTAGGDPSLFARADELVKSAPNSKRWRFISLKPGSGFDFIHTRAGKDFDPGTMLFDPLFRGGDRTGPLGLVVAMPSSLADDPGVAEQAVWNILETALGERATAARIRFVRIRKWVDEDLENLIALNQLVAYLKWLEA